MLSRDRRLVPAWLGEDGQWAGSLSTPSCKNKLATHLAQCLLGGLREQPLSQIAENASSIRLPRTGWGKLGPGLSNDGLAAKEELLSLITSELSVVQ